MGWFDTRHSLPATCKFSFIVAVPQAESVSLEKGQKTEPQRRKERRENKALKRKYGTKTWFIG
jgi:hypothetical protein